MDNTTGSEQRRDKTLPLALYQNIVGFLTGLPGIHDSNTQRALVYGANLDNLLLDQLCFGIPAKQFIQILVPTLARYGRLDDDRNALIAVLNAAREYVGSDRRQECERLIAAVREQVEPPQEQRDAALERGIERLRQAQAQEAKIRQTSQRKSVGNKPAADKLFVDREVYLDRLAQYVRDADTRQIIIVGQGGMGKTALAAKFCDEIEKAGYNLISISTTLDDRGRGETPSLPPIERSRDDDGGAFPIRAIVYVSKTEMAAFTMDQIFQKLAQTLEPEDEARLSPLLRDPQAGAALKTETLLDALQSGVTLLVLDNFETLLAETAIQDQDLERFLKTVCETRHGLKVIITSRRSVALDVFCGLCEPIHLNTGLDPAHAVEFLRKLGQGGSIPQLLRGTPQELRRLAEKAHGVPMALRSFAGFLRSRRRLTLADLLQDEQRFEDFRRHDVQNGLAKLIAEQYALLPQDAKRALQGLAVYQAPVTPVAVQYLFPDLDAETALDALAYDYFLAQRNPSSDRFELHPSVQEFVYRHIGPGINARSQSSSRLKPAAAEIEQGASASLSFETGVLTPGEDISALHRKAADFHAQLKKPQAAWKSLADLQSHLDEIKQSIKAGDYDRAARVLNAIDFRYLQLWGYSRLVIEIREQLLGKLTEEKLIRVNYGNLGLTYWDTGRVKEAIPLYEAALSNARKEKDKGGEGAWLNDLGLAYADLGDLPQAIECYTRALAIAREIGDKQGEGNCLGNLGFAYFNLGDLVQAIEQYTQALNIDRESRDKQGEGVDLGNLGDAYLEHCVQESSETWLSQAIECHQRALEIRKEIGDPLGITFNLMQLGIDYLFALDMNQAEVYFHRCIEACEQALARTQLYMVLYYRAFALLALECVGNPPHPPLIEEAYGKAITVCGAPGVLKERIHEVERLQRILELRGLPVPAALGRTLALLRQALPASGS